MPPTTATSLKLPAELKAAIDAGKHVFCEKTHAVDAPGVKMVMDQGDVNLAGPVKVLSVGKFKEEYGDQFMTPAETRGLRTS